MAAKRSPKREKVAFALILLATFALFGIVGFAFGGDKLVYALLAQTQNVDEDGYLSEYDARIGWTLDAAPRPAAKATDAPAQTDAGIPTTAPVKPEKPRAAR